MSGHGGGTFDDSSPPSCETLSGSTSLTSVQEGALEKINIGDELLLEIDGNSVVAKLEDDIVGTITWTYTGKLIECLEEGFGYIATIRTIDGAHISVNIMMSN